MVEKSTNSKIVIRNLRSGSTCDLFAVFFWSCHKDAIFNMFLVCLFRIIDQRFERVSYFVFGDFNFRLDAKSVVEVGPFFPYFWTPSKGLFFTERMLTEHFQVHIQFAREYVQ